MKQTSLEEPFVLTSWVVAFLDGLHMGGCDDQAIVLKSGVSVDFLERGYCTLAESSAVFNAAEALYGDYVNVSLNKGGAPSSFRSLSMAMLSSETLADCFGLIVKHNSIITNTIDFHVAHKKGGTFGFEIRKDLHVSLSLTSAILARALGTARYIHPGAKLVKKIQLAYKKPVNSKLYEQYFNAPVIWDSPKNIIYFDEIAFYSRSTQADKNIKDNAERNWLKEIAQFNELNFIQRVNLFLKASIGERRLTIEYAANEFSMSVRTFQRRLKMEQTSFSQLIDKLREDQAQELIKNNSIAISDVAFSLGFSDAGSFSRAFRRWFGGSPEKYRKNLA